MWKKNKGRLRRRMSVMKRDEGVREKERERERERGGREIVRIG
jgi:hypothetical protein